MDKTEKHAVHFYSMEPDSAGFCSDINNLAYAIYYFEQHNLPYAVISDRWRSSDNEIWSTYFDSLEVQHRTHSQRMGIVRRILQKAPSWSFKHPSGILVLKRILSLAGGSKGICRGTPRFRRMRKYCRLRRREDEEAFFEAIRKIFATIWTLRPELLPPIQQGSALQADYIALHIRRGDKIASGEDLGYESKLYAEKLLSLDSPIRRIFLMTDDYKSYHQLKELLPDYTIETSARETDQGWRHREFKQLPPEAIRSETIRLIADIEMARAASIFMGTYGSNVFRLIEFLRQDACISISPRTRRL